MKGMNKYKKGESNYMKVKRCIILTCGSLGTEGTREGEKI